MSSRRVAGSGEVALEPVAAGPGAGDAVVDEAEGSTNGVLWVETVGAGPGSGCPELGLRVQPRATALNNIQCLPRSLMPKRR